MTTDINFVAALYGNGDLCIENKTITTEFAITPGNAGITFDSTTNILTFDETVPADDYSVLMTPTWTVESNGKQSVVTLADIVLDVSVVEDVRPAVQAEYSIGTGPLTISTPFAHSSSEFVFEAKSRDFESAIVTLADGSEETLDATFLESNGVSWGIDGVTIDLDDDDTLLADASLTLVMMDTYSFNDELTWA